MAGVACGGRGLGGRLCREEELVSLSLRWQELCERVRQLVTEPRNFSGLIRIN
jgi:hypothetical protein